MRREYEEVEVADEMVLGEVEEEVLVEEAEMEMDIEPISYIGVVSGCKKLNVRPDASTNNDPLCVIEEGTALVIDVRESVEGWYKVYTETGVEGFCMVQYITIKE